MKPTVLIVDDSETNRYLLSFYLRQLGLAVQEARSGAQALELATACAPQLVLLDLHMPDMDGFETAVRLRALPGCAVLPIVAVTANVSDSARSAARRAGFSGFLAKPIDTEAFPAEIARYLNPPAP